MKKFKVFISESVNDKIIYHFTSIYEFVKIIDSMTILGFKPKKRLELDYELIKRNFKIVPYQEDFDRKKYGGVAEEVIIANNLDLNKYLIGISVVKPFDYHASEISEDIEGLMQDKSKMFNFAEKVLKLQSKFKIDKNLIEIVNYILHGSKVNLFNDNPNNRKLEYDEDGDLCRF